MKSFSQKHVVWLSFVVLIGIVNGILLSLKGDFEGEIEALSRQEQAARQDILEATAWEQKRDHYNDLRQKAAAEKYACAASFQDSIKLKKTLSKALKKHHLFDSHLKSNGLKESHLHKRTSFTLFVSATLDTDIYGFIDTLSHDLSGLVLFHLVSLFREDEGTLKSEIQISLLTPLCQATKDYQGKR